MAKGKNFDWAPHRKFVMDSYQQGNSPISISEKIGVSRSAVVAFLKREGVLRTPSEAQKLAAKWGRQDHNTRGKGQRRPGMGHHVFLDRICEHCEKQYVALAGTQKYCDECVPDDEAGHRMNRYGLSKPDCDLLLEKQNGTCALCSRTERLVIDHCHRTDHVRGFLCYRCNIALGAIDEDPAWAERALEYSRAS